MKPIQHKALYLLWKQKGRCYYCEVDLLTLPYEQITRDHTIPKSEGGKELVMSCVSCNRLKGNKNFDDWMRWVNEHKEALKAYNEIFNDLPLQNL